MSALTLCAGVGLSACGDDEPSHSLVGYRPSGVQQVAAVAMTDASAGGAPFEFRADEGKLLIAYFGYTSCPDVCPTTLAMLKTALARLGDDADRVQLAMATIDPARDTAEVLTGYVQSFVPDAHAVRTDDAAVLREVTDAFGVSYMVTAGVDGSVEVAHSGAMYVVDDQGDLLLTWPFGVTADDVEGDLGVILGEIDARAEA
jgi:protein SCO1